MPLAYNKEPRIEIPRLLELARNQPRPCMLNVPGQCRLPGRRSQGGCVACHGNLAEFNKGRGVKAHDFFSVWGCPWCHTWLDESYVASGAEREETFRIALTHQIDQWGLLAADPLVRPKDRDPIRQALQELAARGYAQLEPHSRIQYAFPIHPGAADYARQQAAA